MRFLILTLALILSEPVYAQYSPYGGAQNPYAEVQNAFKYDPYAGSPTNGQWTYAQPHPNPEPMLQRNYGIPNPYAPQERICIIIEDAYGHPQKVCE